MDVDDRVTNIKGFDQFDDKSNRSLRQTYNSVATPAPSYGGGEQCPGLSLPCGDLTFVIQVLKVEGVACRLLFTWSGRFARSNGQSG